MKLVFGLGNPGIRFLNTRHNLGSSVVKKLAKRFKIKLRPNKSSDSLIGKGEIRDKDIILAIPLKFMNICGEVLRELLKKFKIDLKEILIICDDMDLERGKIRFRLKGSDAGHKGLRSIIGNLKTEKFSRLKLGIGRPPLGLNPTEYVLGRFSRSELKEIDISIEKAIFLIEDWLEKN